MKIIFGFGNPGKEYNFTRHNFGFLTLDFYSKIHNLSWNNKPKFFADIAKDDEHDLLLVEPQTFYNEVGQCVQAVCQFYKADPKTDILVVCDDFNLEFGQLRYRQNGSAGGNNGLKSTISSLGTEDFPRLRLGTGNEAMRKKVGDVDFVLGKFTEEEYAQLPNILKGACDYLANYSKK